jgi:hypothetical protein
MEAVSPDMLEIKFAAAKAYRLHLADQFRDREVMKALHSASLSSEVLEDTVIMLGDGMDQARWRLPRDPHLRTAMSMTKAKRPSCVVHCIWALNRRLDFFVMDKNMAHGSDSVIQCVATAIERIVADCRQNGRRPPKNIIYWARRSVACEYTS